MAWLAISRAGQEAVYPKKPTRADEWFWSCIEVVENDGGWYRDEVDLEVELPSGSIEKLIGRPLTWKDEPVEI